MQSQNRILFKVRLFSPPTFHIGEDIILVQYYVMLKNQNKNPTNVLEVFVVYKAYAFRLFLSETTYVIPCFMSGASNTLEAFVL